MCSDIVLSPILYLVHLQNFGEYTVSEMCTYSIYVFILCISTLLLFRIFYNIFFSSQLKHTVFMLILLFYE